jgi:hypothetical protein
MRRLAIGKREQIIGLLVDNNSMGVATRSAGCSISTVVR